MFKPDKNLYQYTPVVLQKSEIKGICIDIGTKSGWIYGEGWYRTFENLSEEIPEKENAHNKKENNL